ncbi:MAG: hypothetical protein ACI85S_001937, partial [Pseudohongiellaceae bacterium]
MVSESVKLSSAADTCAEVVNESWEQKALLAQSQK